MLLIALKKFTYLWMGCDQMNQMNKFINTILLNNKSLFAFLNTRKAFIENALRKIKLIYIKNCTTHNRIKVIFSKNQDFT